MADQKLSKMDWISIGGTVVLTVIGIVVAQISVANDSYFTLAVSMSALGGLAHETKKLSFCKNELDAFISSRRVVDEIELKHRASRSAGRMRLR